MERKRNLKKHESRSAKKLMEQTKTLSTTKLKERETFRSATRRYEKVKDSKCKAHYNNNETRRANTFKETRKRFGAPSKLTTKEVRRSANDLNENKSKNTEDMLIATYLKTKCRDWIVLKFKEQRKWFGELRHTREDTWSPTKIVETITDAECFEIPRDRQECNDHHSGCKSI